MLKIFSNLVFQSYILSSLWIEFSTKLIMEEAVDITQFATFCHGILLVCFTVSVSNFNSLGLQGADLSHVRFVVVFTMVLLFMLLLLDKFVDTLNFFTI